jgi:phosphoglycolate phosphatase-like HAD superfamily hydrolase
MIGAGKRRDRMYGHVIWDFDGTLFDTYPSMVGALAYALEKRGHAVDEAEILSLMKVSAGVALSSYMEKYGYGDDFLAEYRARRRAIELDASRPYPGAAALLGEIVARGGYNYILTHRGDTLFPMLERHGLLPLFRECLTARSGFPRKPDPAGICYLIEKYDMPTGGALMVGDRELDILSGKGAGIATCDYWDGSGPRVDAADFVARDFGELRKVILG